jgi:porphobilinogen synthase
MFDRHRRLRSNSQLRQLVRETTLAPSDFIYPVFVVEGEGVKREIETLPGCYHYSVDRLEEIVEALLENGISGVLLFGIPKEKDEIGSASFDEDGIIQRSIRKIKSISSKLLVVTDICMCEYTSHGHCGIVKNGKIDNDKTLEYLSKIALSHARAGADIVAPSDMMDGRIGVIRQVLDSEGFSNLPIMSYSAKYASAFYGPFREAAHSTPQFGDRKSYQMDPGNAREAMREIESDIDEGADIVMVKPALSYLDVIRWARDRYALPIAAYSVSGEYAMVKAAAEKGLINEKAIVMEILLSIKRAGADIIITYSALEAARWLRERD